MRSVNGSGEAWPLWKNATCRTGVRSGWRRHRVRNGHSRQVVLVPLNLWWERPLVVHCVQLLYRDLSAGQTRGPAFAGTKAVEVMQATLHEQPPALAGSTAIVAFDRVIR